MVIVEELDNIFNEAEEIIVYDNDVKTSYKAGSPKYGEILESWNITISSAHQMPALGVSIDEYTRKELKSGIWLEFCFDTVYECCGMPFEKLLIGLDKEYYGFNLIRYTAEHGYEGRCFYLDLFGKNTNDLYDLLSNI